jgi:hypothetical protein
MPPVQGSYVFSDWASLECLRLLENMLAMAGYANFGYQDEFKKAYAVGDTVRIKLPQEFLVTDGFDYNPQAINRQQTSVTVDNPMQIAFEWDSIEAALKLERSKKQISREYIQPTMAQMSQEIETRFMDFAFFNCPNVVGTLASVPTSWDTYAQANQRMIELAGSEGYGQDAIGVTPAMMRTLISNSLTQFNPPDEIAKQYKKSMVGNAAGWDWFRSMSCHPHTTGIWNTVATGVTVATSGQSGNSINLSCTTGDTFKRGDIVNFASSFYVNPRTKRSTGTLRQFKVMQDAIGAASVVTLSIYPSIVGPGSPYQNVSALPVAADVVTLWPGTTMANAAAKSGILGLGLNKLGYAIAGVELMMPQEGGPVSVSSQRRDPNTGLSMALISMFSPESRKQINRLDCLIGFGALYADRASVLIASSS